MMDPSAMKEAFSSIGQDRVDAGKQRLRLLPDGRLVTSFVTEERLEELMNFEHSTSDVWITTYPKSGTTWCQYVAFLLAGNEPDAGFTSKVPWLEVGMLFASPLDQLPEPVEGKPRLFKSHWWSSDHMVPNSKSRFIYIMRNGLDVAVSFFHHTYALRLYDFHGNLDDFFELFMSDDVDFGGWWQHCLGWWERSKVSDDVLWIHYEDMKRDPATIFGRIASFMGVQASKERIDEVVKLTTVTAMKELAAGAQHKETIFRKEDGASHIRNGVVGESKQVLSEEQRARFMARCEKEFANSDIPWRQAMP